MNETARAQEAQTNGIDSPRRITEFEGYPSQAFVVKDSGKRQEFSSGMVRDTQEGKPEYDRVFDGVLIDRLAAHLTKGAAKYPDNEDGTPNWTLANSTAELKRFKKSATRHFRQWLRGDQDEDHFAAVTFNMNSYETTLAKIDSQKSEGK